MPHDNEGGTLATEPIQVVTDMNEDLIAMAQRAAEMEKAMPFKEALRIFWRGGLWSMGLSLALVMEGYDVGLVSGRAILVNTLTDYRSSNRSLVIQLGSRNSDRPIPLPADFMCRPPGKPH